MSADVPPFATMRVAYSPDRRACDLVIAPMGQGRGAIAIDTSPASALLLAFGTDRRARDDDALPASATGLLAMRGWCGSLVSGAEIGARLWLLQRAKHTEATRSAAAGYAAEAVGDISTRHDVEIGTSAAWANPTTLVVTAQAVGMTFSLPVAIQ